MKNKFAKILMLLITIAGCYFIAGCSSEDGPSQKIDYGKLTISRLDIKDAVSLGLSRGGSSRTIDGEFLSAGLYKIDAAGNISAVGVYFTTDTLGNRLEHEEKLKVVPKKMFDISENYLYLIQCIYYDSDGDTVENRWDDNSNLVYQEVPYKDLLVRKSDGKIWCIDNISEILLYQKDILSGKFKEDSSGELYFKKTSAIFKFNLSENTSSFEQMTNYAEYTSDDDFFITDNGIFWMVKPNFHPAAELNITWPHSGFQNMTSHSIGENIRSEINRTIPGCGLLKYRENTINVDYIKLELDNLNSFEDLSFQNYRNNPIAIFSCFPRFYAHDTYKDSDVEITNYNEDYAKVKEEQRSSLDELFEESNWPFGLMYEIEIGTSAGSAVLCDNPIQLTGLPNGIKWSDCNQYNSQFKPYGGYFKSAYIGPNYILMQGPKNWISKIDLDKREWKWIKCLDFSIDFSTSLLYSGKVWAINDSRENFGAYWFDPVTLEDGFVKFNVEIPSFFHFTNEHKKFTNISNDGTYTKSEADPATGNIVTIVIDILTGESVTNVDTPKMLFETLINLN